jgi:hypothetical protein
MDALRGAIRDEIVKGLPYVGDPASGEPLTGVVEPSVSWEYLEMIHDALANRIPELVSDRGSAEWLWWLRRLRGQFDRINKMSSTGPYVQGLAEALAAGQSRPSARPTSERFEFALTDQTLHDLVWLSEMSEVMYHLHAAMKRCAKGEAVLFVPGEIPRWDPYKELDDAIEDYDKRVERETGNLLQAVGVAAPRATEPGPENTKIGGLVPYWSFAQARKPPAFSKADPLPVLMEWIDLDRIQPLWEQNVLTNTHVALIALLWACMNIVAREPEHVQSRITSALQWGYILAPTEGFLAPALDEMAEWLVQGAGAALSGCWMPTSGAELLHVLCSMKPEIWPPLCGSPIHEADGLSLVDVVGASRRLFTTLVRPADDTEVNYWSAHFEQDTQAAIDVTPWRPEGQWRTLVGRYLHRQDGSILTNVDAVGYRSGRLLLVSCKSIARTVPALRGEFGKTRNIVQTVHQAAEKWEAVTAAVRADRSMLGVAIDRDVIIEGCVVFPSVPYFTDRQWRRMVFRRIPYLGSISEFGTALARA